jgi:hypothetical protein
MSPIRARRTGLCARQLTLPADLASFAVAHTGAVSSPLSAVPFDRRRRAARSAELLAVVLVAVFVVAWVRPAPGVVRVFTSLGLAGAVLLALMSWGVRRTIKVDAEARAIDAAIAQSDLPPCNCGHAHVQSTTGSSGHTAGRRAEPGSSSS